MIITDSFLKEIPKVDLHLHLDGSLRLHTLIELAQKNNVALPFYDEANLLQHVFREKYEDLWSYLQCFQYTCAVMQKADDLTRIAYELAQDCIAEGIRYIEVRFAPQLHMTELSFDEVLIAVNTGLQRAQDEFLQNDSVVVHKEPPFYYGIICSALRMFDENTSGWYGAFYKNFDEPNPKKVFAYASLELARNAVRCKETLKIPIVGLDLAGNEDGFPAKDHREAFMYAHQYFMRNTIHAGEAYNARSIFEALTHVHADRIGHGYFIFDRDKLELEEKLFLEEINMAASDFIEGLVNYISERRITIEVCVSSNLQTQPEKGILDHPIWDMLEKRMSIVICTDNRLMSNTSVCKEMRLLHESRPNKFGLEQIKRSCIYGFKRSFLQLPYVEKRAYVRQCIDFLEQVIEKHKMLQQ